jgi:hypothetical protein
MPLAGLPSSQPSIAGILALAALKPKRRLAETRREYVPVRGVQLETLRQVEAGVRVTNSNAHQATSFAAGGREPFVRYGRGIAGRKRFRKLLNRVEIDGESSRMHGDDVRLGCPGEARLLAIDLASSYGEPGADQNVSSAEANGIA